MALKPGREEQQINKHVGRRIKERREQQGMSQTDLGSTIGVSHQVIHRVEQGGVSISVGRLQQLARSLDEDVDVFFAGAEQQSARPLRPRLIMELMHEFNRIPEQLKEDAVRLVRGLAQFVERR